MVAKAHPQSVKAYAAVSLLLDSAPRNIFDEKPVRLDVEASPVAVA